jgi:hypothetical protein
MLFRARAAEEMDETLMLERMDVHNVIYMRWRCVWIYNSSFYLSGYNATVTRIIGALRLDAMRAVSSSLRMGFAEEKQYEDRGAGVSTKPSPRFW